MDIKLFLRSEMVFPFNEVLKMVDIGRRILPTAKKTFLSLFSVILTDYNDQGFYEAGIKSPAIRFVLWTYKKRQMVNNFVELP